MTSHSEKKGPSSSDGFRPMKLTRIHGQPSWRFSSNRVDAAITRQGGHLAPVRFRLPRGEVEPFSVAPWAEEKSSSKLPALLQSLRGDFFCAPFGGNVSLYNGERHLPHGETANAPWKLESLTEKKGDTELHLSLRTHVRAGRVDKILRLRPGETVIYCRHVLSGMSGKMNLGHHATLKFPDVAGSGFIDMSPISFAQVLPVPFEKPAEGGYCSLKTGAIFSRLDQVPSADGSTTDLSRYPARRGLEDLVMITHEVSPDFAWTAVTFPSEHYVWFALKDPRVLRSTVLWISNGGRHYPPWNGRHVSVMGLEDVTSYFHLGLAESARPNPVSKRGIATYLTLKANTPLTVNYIMGVAATPREMGARQKDLATHARHHASPDRGKSRQCPARLQLSHFKKSMKRNDINHLIRSAEMLRHPRLDSAAAPPPPLSPQCRFTFDVAPLYPAAKSTRYRHHRETHEFCRPSLAVATFPPPFKAA